MVRCGGVWRNCVKSSTMHVCSAVGDWRERLWRTWMCRLTILAKQLAAGSHHFPRIYVIRAVCRYFGCRFPSTLTRFLTFGNATAHRAPLRVRPARVSPDRARARLTTTCAPTHSRSSRRRSSSPSAHTSQMPRLRTGRSCTASRRGTPRTTPSSSGPASPRRAVTPVRRTRTHTYRFTFDGESPPSRPRPRRWTRSPSR